MEPAASVDLREVPWVKGKYSPKELGDSLSVHKRVHTIAQAITYYLSDPHTSCTVCFCATTSHAQYMATELTKLGFKAQFLTGQTSSENRREYQRQLKKKEINFLCVVDIFNEGIDIPEVDTVLFLRPTESLTVYLQ